MRCFSPAADRERQRCAKDVRHSADDSGDGDGWQNIEQGAAATVRLPFGNIEQKTFATALMILPVTAAIIAMAQSDTNSCGVF